ncbi:hypothetical protein [Mesorhizobium japonicum]|uniref:Mll1768 protein n=1 Tax=Mesorhizobium japonicum (strain LMG 29417 / CECT 9101 / MAFF 303099) TaxID=266835 RepID=Q98JV0_RHILO|nr:hypothetical protein [Mesorhizobium japonicum]BAB49065.1 mll1768 [Mesorhizobium japonicum MAFF 303099]
MSAAKLIQAFSKRTEVPIDIIDDVIPAVRKLGFDGEIYWFYADVDPTVLRGSVVHWSYPTSPGGPEINVAEITVAKALPDDWRRFVACKELIHLLDPVGSQVKSEADFAKLIERLSLPTEMQDFKEDGMKVLTDRIAITQALAVLFPLAARDELYGPFKEGKIPLADVARIVDIPTRYVALAMTEFYPPIYKFLCDF